MTMAPPTDGSGSPAGESPPGWVSGRQQGLHALREAVRQAIALADSQQIGRMLWCDRDFADWPLEERAVVEALQRWALGGGRLEMLASDFRPLQARAARFVQWRRQWDHRFEARALGRQRPDEVPTVLRLGDQMLLGLDAEQRLFVVTADRSRIAQTDEHCRSLWQQAVPAFPASTLGL